LPFDRSLASNSSPHTMKRSLRTLSTAARTARATPAPCSHLPRPSALASSRAFSSTPAKALATVSDLELAKDLKITGDEPLHVAPAADMLGFEVSETQPAGGADVGRPIYLDAQATTPTDPRVLDAMLPYMTNQYGNPHSKTHAYGWETEKAVEQGRQVRFSLGVGCTGAAQGSRFVSQYVADLIGANAKDVVFTSGATESNNMSIKGIARFNKGKKKHM
jgi:cysteine desulfurase